MLILARHGQSTRNRDKVIAGNSEVPLTDEGRAETRKVAEELHGTTLAHAFASPLGRSQETLSIFLEVLNQHPPVTVAPELMERNLGVVTGHPEADYPPEEKKTWFTWTGAPEGGESYYNLHQRLIPWFTREVLPLAQTENVLIVSHNAVMKVLRQYLEQVDPEQTGTLENPNSGLFWYEVAADGSVKRVKAPVGAGGTTE